jgi:PAS domain S-box-containing protein
VLLWAVAYFASIALMVVLHVAAEPPIWYAPVAVGVGLLAACGLRWWPVIVVSEAVGAVLAYGQPLAAIFGVGLPTALETLAVAWALRRLRFGLADADAALRLSLTAFAACVGAATIGVGLLFTLDLVPDPAMVWLAWWVGDLTGLATLLPLVLSLRASGALRSTAPPNSWASVEAVLLLSAEAVLVAGTAVLANIDPLHREDARFLWAIPVIVAAVRWDRRTTAAVIAVMGATAFTAFSQLPAASGVGGALGLQTTLVSIGLAGMSIAIAVSNRRQAAVELAAKTEALDESEHRYATLFERSPVIQMLVDPATAAILEANEAAVAYYGYSPDEFRRMAIPQLSLAEPGAIREVLHEQSSGRMHVVARHRLATGGVRTMEIQTGPLSIGGRQVLHAVVRDITDEISVRRQIARLAAAVESSADAVVTTDLDGVVTSWNPAAEHLYGYPRDVAVGTPIEQLLGHLSISHSELAELVRSQGVARFGHLSRINAAGDMVPVDLVVTQILDEDGNLVGLSRLAHDLRQLFEEQERVRRSEALLADAARIGGVGSWEVEATTGDTTWSGELYRLTSTPPGSPVNRTSLLDLVYPDDRPAVAAAFAAGDGERIPVEFRLITADGHERSMVATWRVVPGADGSPGREIGVVRDVTE